VRKKGAFDGSSIPGATSTSFARDRKPIRGLWGVFLHKREKERLTVLRHHRIVIRASLAMENLRPEAITASS
jgi:hypothetical protein